MMQILVIVPQHNELSYFLDALQQEGYKVDKVQFGSIKGAKIHGLKMTVATGGYGKAQFRGCFSIGMKSKYEFSTPFRSKEVETAPAGRSNNTGQRPVL